MSTVLGQPVTLGGEGAVKYNTAQELTVAQKETAQKNIGVTWPCNPNLLDNWYFINPINQRRQTGFAADSAYILDRWMQYIGRSAINSLTTEGLQLTTVKGETQGLVQRLPATQMPSGRVYTLSALLKIASDTSSHETNANVALSYGINGNNNDGTNYVPKTQPIGRWFVHTFTFTFPETTNDTVNVRLRLANVGDTTVVVRAMKLELGGTQTLAHQDANGNWVLNEIPDYGEQLARCQRYAVPLATDAYYVGRVSASSTTTVFVSVPTPASMRETPVLAGGAKSQSDWRIYAIDQVHTPTAVVVEAYGASTVTLRFTIPTAITTNTPVVCAYVGTDAGIISADL